MLLFLLFIALTVIGIILEVLYKKLDAGKNWDILAFEIVAVCMIVMGGIALFCTTPIIMVENCCYERHYLDWQIKYENLNARLNSDIRDDMLGHDIQQYNTDLRNAKYWHNNIWTSWLNEGACLEFEEIKIEDIKGQ